MCCPLKADWWPCSWLWFLFSTLVRGSLALTPPDGCQSMEVHCCAFFPPTILSFLSSKDFLGFYVKMSLVFRFSFLSLLDICWCICWSKFITQPKCQHLQASSQPLPHFLRTAVIAMLIECHFQRKFPDLHLFHENEILFHSLSAFCWLLNPECTYLKAMSPRFFFLSWLILIIFTYRPLFLAWKCNYLVKRC